jgi:hypothetical protein
VRELGGEQILTVINLKGKKTTVSLQQSASRQIASPILTNGIIGGDPYKGLELEGYGFWVGNIRK